MAKNEISFSDASEDGLLQLVHMSQDEKDELVKKFKEKMTRIDWRDISILPFEKEDHVELDCLLVPFGMPPADEIQAINAALQERGLDASNIVSVRATGTPKEGVMVYFRVVREEPRQHPLLENTTCEKHSIGNCPFCRSDRPQCEHGLFPYGDVPHCPKCLAENAQVK